MQAYIAYLLLISVQAMLFHRGIPVPSKNDAGETVYVRKDGKRFLLMLSCIELIILTGLRGYTVGADTKTYIDALTHYTGISFTEVFTAKLVWPFDFEIGYFFFTKLCGFLHISPTLFLIIIACIIYIPVFKYICRESAHPYISVLVYFAFGFFSYSLGIFRQFIAIGIILSAIRYIEERRLLKYLIAVLIAMLFHTTAFIALPLYLLVRIDWRKKAIMIAILVSEIVLVIVGRIVIEIAIKLFPSYAGYLGGIYDVQGGSYLNLIFLNIVLFAFIFLKRSKPHNDARTALICAQLVIAILLQCCAYHMALFGRIVPYYSIALMIAIPDIIDGACEATRLSHAINRLTKSGRLFGTLLKIGVCTILIALIYKDLSGNSYVTPFYFFWDTLPKS